MKSFCKHQPHRIVDWVKSPKYSTDQILINVDALRGDIDHYLFQFSDEGPREQFGWFHLNKATIVKSKIQPNGRGKVYAVDLDLREDFIPLLNCNHEI